MNREDIIRMAEEAGARQQVSCFTHPEGPVTAYQFKVDEGSLERFAQLVAAHEREQCALLCREEAHKQQNMRRGIACAELAQKIRSRNT